QAGAQRPRRPRPAHRGELAARAGDPRARHQRFPVDAPAQRLALGAGHRGARRGDPRRADRARHARAARPGDGAAAVRRAERPDPAEIRRRRGQVPRARRGVPQGLRRAGLSFLRCGDGDALEPRRRRAPRRRSAREARRGDGEGGERASALGLPRSILSGGAMAAAKKKGKAKVKAKKAPAKKKSPAKKKVLKKAAAPKKKAAAARKKPAPRPAAKPKPKPVEAPVRGPAPGEVRVGVVTHYYGHLSVAAVKLEVALAVGQTIRVLGHTSDFKQRVDSIQIEHEQVQEAIGGDEIGIKVAQHASEHDVVYRVP